jgi:hypothetical protein
MSAFECLTDLRVDDEVVPSRKAGLVRYLWRLCENTRTRL